MKSRKCVCPLDAILHADDSRKYQMYMARLPRGLLILGLLIALMAVAQASAAAPASMINFADDDVTTTIQQVIKQSNDEQVQAIATRNLSLVTDTTTSDHFQDIANSLQDLLNHQVTGISILQLDFGPVTVSSDGSSATATTFESWRINSTAGSIDYDPVRNDYTLVLDNGTWKIKSVQQDATPAPTPVPTATPVATPSTH